MDMEWTEMIEKIYLAFSRVFAIKNEYGVAVTRLMLCAPLS